MDKPRPLLTRLRAENVRSFATLDLELGPMTVLVGPNGAGKSNVVSAIRLIRDIAVGGSGNAEAKQNGRGFLIKQGETSAMVRVEVSFRWGSVYWLYQLGEDGSILSTIDFVDDSVILIGEEDFYQAFERIKREEPDANRDPTGWLRRVFVSQPEPMQLRDRVQRTDPDSSMKEDFSNLGAVLLAIRGTLFADEINRSLALLVDGVTGYTVLQAGSTLVPQILYGPDDARDLGLESDGTIRLVALLAALYQPIPPSLIVLEEPEMGLHPGVLGALAEIIDEATLRMQVLVTTHSPDLIDRFDPDAVRIVEKVNGESVIGRVDPEQRDLIHKRLYRPSELMRMEGLVREPG